MLADLERVMWFFFFYGNLFFDVLEIFIISIFAVFVESVLIVKSLSMTVLV